MIIACIDLQRGKAVQLVRGRRRKLAVDDVLGLLHRFRKHPVLHVIDLDAAMRCGSNGGLVRRLCRASKARVHVGGGIRTVARAERMIRWGAAKVIVGSAAFQDGRVNHAFLRALQTAIGRRRVIVALDTEKGSIVIRGWRQRLALSPQAVMPEIEPYCSEFLCTCVDTEGTMRGTDLRWFRSLRKVTRLPITAAGGIRSRAEVRALERLGMNAAIGMALYTDRLR